jgi:phospholipid/cholesterol/gamma-HCH transport system substrate-binding protein
LDDNEENISNILTNFSSLSDSLAKADVGGTFINVNRSMTDLQNIIQRINNGEGTVGKLLQNDSLYFHLEKSAADLNRLLEDIKLHPKRYVKFSIF